MARLSWHQMGMCFMAAAIDFMFAVMFAICIQLHLRSKHGIRPMHDCVLFAKHNISYVFAIVGGCLLICMSVLGKPWNALYFMVNWLEES